MIVGLVYVLPKWALIVSFSSVQSLSCVRIFATPWTAACKASLSITNSRSPPKAMSIESVMPSNHLILCCPLLLLPSIFPSIRVFSNESALRIRWPKYWSFSFNIGSSDKHPGLMSFTMDWLDLLAVQGTPKSLLQHHSLGITKFTEKYQHRSQPSSLFTSHNWPFCWSELNFILPYVLSFKATIKMTDPIRRPVKAWGRAVGHQSGQWDP